MSAQFDFPQYFVKNMHLMQMQQYSYLEKNTYMILIAIMATEAKKRVFSYYVSLYLELDKLRLEH